MMQFAQIAESNVRFHSSLMETGQCIAASAIRSIGHPEEVFKDILFRIFFKFVDDARIK